MPNLSRAVVQITGQRTGYAPIIDGQLARRIFFRGVDFFFEGNPAKWRLETWPWVKNRAR